IVPYTRGQERSRKEEDILAEVRCLKESGYKQVTLLGQNVDAYGKDFNDKYAFASLLDKVASTGIERVRFVTPYPSDFNTEVFDVMKKHDNIMPCIHMPLQSGSNEVLKKMNRRYTKEQFLSLIHELRERIPDIAITTDIIVGFPNETEKDFLDTLELAKEVKFDAAFTFIFSPRPGTPAYRMENISTEKEIHDRFNRLKTLIDSQTEEKSQSYLNQELEVLFEDVSKKNKEMITGYDRHGKLVHVKADETLIGQIRKVHIIESHTFSLIGELIND
ncbi:MAG: MiaB/RimO family radical SAM methylthiotransferase, partial [Bacilli bacterium]